VKFQWISDYESFDWNIFLSKFVFFSWRDMSAYPSGIFLGLWNYFSRLDSKLFFQISLETRLLLTGCKNEIISQVCSLWITIITILQWYLDQNSRHNEKARTIQKRIRRIHKLRGYRRIFVYNVCLINICDTDFDGAKKKNKFWLLKGDDTINFLEEFKPDVWNTFSAKRV